MTKIWTETGFVENDPWIVAAEGEVHVADRKQILPLAAFLDAVEASNETGFGVLITPADNLEALEPYIDRIVLIALSFPAFSDGRAFSHASLLRDRLGYKDEVRAVGDVLIDQIPLMIRCGISSFAVANETAIARLQEGRLPGISRHYQPSTKAANAAESYSWRRRAC